MANLIEIGKTMANLIEIGKTIADETWGQVQEQKTERQEAFNLQLPENVVAKQDKDGNYSILQLSDKMMKKYGVLQDIVTQSSDEDALTKAQRILDDNGLPKEDITVECIGDLDYQVGYGVHVMFPWYKQYQDCYMYVKEVTNKWYSDGTFVSSLVLTPSRVMDEMDWEASSDDGSNSNNSTEGQADSIIALARSFIGVPYLRGGTTPQGFDCSGLVQYCYNKFSDQLLCSLQRTTYTQCLQGKSVNKNDENAWREGDLIFFIGKGQAPAHVAILSKKENGKWWIIEAPYTGEKIREVELTRSDIYSVRRVIKDIEASSSGGVVGTGIKLGNNFFTKDLIGFIEKSEGFRSQAYSNSTGYYIGYGFAYQYYPHLFPKGKENSTITQAKAEEILIGICNGLGREIQTYLNRAGKIVSPFQLDGLIAVGYQLGIGTVKSYILPVIVKGGDIQQAFINANNSIGGTMTYTMSAYTIFKQGIYRPFNS